MTLTSALNLTRPDLPISYAVVHVACVATIMGPAVGPARPGSFLRQRDVDVI
jgi:hypothetical protein